MALPQNRQAVLKLLEELEPRILGQTRRNLYWSEDTHRLTLSDQISVAVAIEPAGDDFPGQETQWPLWSVKMEPPQQGQKWRSDLGTFIDAHKLDDLFTRYFPQKGYGNPYRLVIDGEDRIRAGLPAAVRIQDNNSLTDFSFSWGREQWAANQLRILHRSHKNGILNGTDAFAKVISLLAAIHPEVYRGGPDPELAYESAWRLDYVRMLELVKAQAKMSRLGSVLSVYDHWSDSQFLVAKAQVAFIKA